MVVLRHAATRRSSAPTGSQAAQLRGRLIELKKEADFIMQTIRHGHLRAGSAGDVPGGMGSGRSPGAGVRTGAIRRGPHGNQV
jgi:hypothetical protein